MGPNTRLDDRTGSLIKPLEEIAAGRRKQSIAFIYPIANVLLFRSDGGAIVVFQRFKSSDRRKGSFKFTPLFTSLRRSHCCLDLFKVNFT